VHGYDIKVWSLSTLLSCQGCGRLGAGVRGTSCFLSGSETPRVQWLYHDYACGLQQRCEAIRAAVAQFEDRERPNGDLLTHILLSSRCSATEAFQKAGCDSEEDNAAAGCTCSYTGCKAMALGRAGGLRKGLRRLPTTVPLLLSSITGLFTLGFCQPRSTVIGDQFTNPGRG
jgi:hypothetical protein